MKLVRMWNRLDIPCNDASRVFMVQKLAMPTKLGLSQWRMHQIMANGCCFAVVSVIAECWHIKLRHM